MPFSLSVIVAFVKVAPLPSLPEGRAAYAAAARSERVASAVGAAFRTAYVVAIVTVWS